MLLVLSEMGEGTHMIVIINKYFKRSIIALLKSFERLLSNVLTENPNTN